jgi:hypothetical protein
MKSTPPKVVGHGAEHMRFVCYAEIPQGKRRIVEGESLAGPGPREEYAYAIFEADGGYFLFTCDPHWRVMWDSWSETLEICKEQLADAKWIEVR